MTLKQLSKNVLPLVFCIFFLSYAEANQTKLRKDQVARKNGGKPYTVYLWPEKVQKRNYKKLGEEMLKYSLRVGTVFNKEPEGTGEWVWSSNERNNWYGLQGKRFSQLNEFLFKNRPSAQSYCNKFISLNMGKKNYVPQGSAYLQYGNCGEGADTAVCLAHLFGFDPKTEIQMCSNQMNKPLIDHAFALVKHPTNKWCILDRWNVIGNFTCGVEYKPHMRTIFHNNKPTTHEWFQKNVKCTPFKEYLRTGGNSVWWK